MVQTVEKFKKMPYQDNGHIRQAIDRHLHKLNVIESNLGIDSTKSELKLAEFEKDLIIKQISDVDEQYFQDVFNLDDEEE